MKRPKTGNRPPLVCAGGRENNLGGSVSPRAQLFFAGCLCVFLVASIVGLPRDIHRVDIARLPCCDFGVGLGQSSLRNKETSPACVGSFGNGHVAEPLGTANPPPPLSCHTPSRIAKCQGWHAGLRRLEWQKTARHVGLHLPQVVLAATSTHQPCCPGAGFATVCRVGFAISCLVRKVARNKGRGCPRRQRRCDLLRGCGGRLIIEPMRPAPSTFQKLTQEEESDLAPDALLLACLFPRLGPANSSICVCFQASNVSRRRVKT